MKESAHPPIKPIDSTMNSEKIAELYSQDHANVYSIIKMYANAEGKNLPLINVLSFILILENNFRFLMQAGKVEVEGWLNDDSDFLNALKKRYPNSYEKLAALEEIINKLKNVKFEQVFPEETKNLENGYVSIATLIDLLKERQIARPSTYASIIENILADDSNEYIIDQGNDLRLMDKAQKVLELLDDMDIPTIDANFTKQLEVALQGIEAGEKAPKDVIKEFTSFITD